MNIYELPLKERFEAADREFSVIYYEKVQAAQAGVRPYPSQEFYEDLLSAAGNWGLFGIALWAYFRVLHGPD
jgi:hypothetical protein